MRRLQEGTSGVVRNGLLDEQQSFWSLLLPDSEMVAVERLEECQRKALAGVRSHASASHLGRTSTEALDVIMINTISYLSSCSVKLLSIDVISKSIGCTLN